MPKMKDQPLHRRPSAFASPAREAAAPQGHRPPHAHEKEFQPAPACRGHVGGDRGTKKIKRLLGSLNHGRVKRSVHAKKKRREMLEKAKGYTGTRHTRYRAAKEQVMHSGNYAYRDRRDRKAQFRRLWIARINAAVRPYGLTTRIHQRAEGGGHRARPKDPRRLAVNDPAAFATLVERPNRPFPLGLTASGEVRAHVRSQPEDRRRRSAEEANVP